MNAQQLKNAILQEAIEGRLVPQDPNDEPASILLARIRKEKEQLVKAGKLKKKDLVVNPISEDEIPFEIPESWEWVRIKSIFSMQAGKNVTSADINSEQNEVFKYPCYGGNGLRGYVKGYNTEGVFPIVGRQGALCGNVNVASGQFWATEHAVVTDGYGITPYKWQYYFLIALNLNQYATATAQPGLAVSNVVEVPIPLPPLAEQHRIVAKIEELLPKVEEYGKAQDALNKLNAELPERLKKSILQEAIEGRLVPQDPNDEPASVLLAKIRKEKEQLVKEGKLKKKDLIETPISEDEIPFEIPESWEWCRLMDICIFLSRGKSPSYSDIPNEYPVFAQKCNLKEGGISLEQARFLNPETVSKWQEEYHLRTDDVLVNSTGTGTVCRTRLFHESYLDNYLFTVPDSHVSVVRTSKCICSAFIFRLFNSKFYQDYWEDRLAGSTNQKELYIGVLQNTIIPLPPLTEQHRIVEKLEQLLGEIDKLKK